jgi:hypothetical protein
MIKTFLELPNPAHTFPLSSDIDHQVIMVEVRRSNFRNNRYADFLEAQGISVQETAPKKVQVPTRRIASLPPHLLTDPESSPGPHKKPRLMPVLSHPVCILSEIHMLGLISISGLFGSSPSFKFFRYAEDNELDGQAGRSV